MEERQNDKEGKSCGRCLSTGKPKMMNTCLMHLALKNWFQNKFVLITLLYKKLNFTSKQI